MLAKYGDNAKTRKAIAAAEKVVKKACPKADLSDNQFSTNSPYECIILDPTGTSLVTLTLDSSLNILGDGSGSKAACVSENACINLVTQRYQVMPTRSLTVVQPART
ncbi:MAG: hypothetical protein HC902_15035, partial [Calothrix sp. SM1_5_4]|nr:hypothetical protein [Calothrix sp. SM1_5_4]